MYAFGAILNNQMAVAMSIYFLDFCSMSLHIWVYFIFAQNMLFLLLVLCSIV